VLAMSSSTPHDQFSILGLRGFPWVAGTVGMKAEQ
jgi:hypothetical protein